MPKQAPDADPLAQGGQALDRYMRTMYGWSTGVAALTELIKQSVNAALGMGGTIVNKMLSGASVRYIFKHQPHKW